MLEPDDDIVEELEDKAELRKGQVVLRQLRHGTE